jgi:ATP-binding cassette subfamily B protein
MLKILKFLKAKEWLVAGVCLVFIVAQIWLELLMPDYMAEITVLAGI